MWARLPEPLDAQAMLARAVTARVAYVPGTAFYADHAAAAGRAHLRLSYCFPTPERITEGVRRLAGVVEAELELIDTFGPGAVSRPEVAPSMTQIRSPAPNLT